MRRPPKNYLPSSSIPWGREVENAYTEIDRNLTRLEGDAEVREIAAGIDMLQANIDGLYKRQPTIMSPKNGITLTTTSGNEASYSWNDWLFTSYRNQTCFFSGSVYMYSQSGDPVTAISVFAYTSVGLYRVFGFGPQGDPATSTTTFSFNEAIFIPAGTYSLSCVLYSGTILPYAPRGATSATYNVSLGIFPE